ncbi:MAG: histidine phosphatase family protein [Pikeienuella sp.]|uniref:histidine phosphatase family protein n=1 Tax=Pikeienuella sp. TaxID=2831957 RepID=UPI0039193D80
MKIGHRFWFLRHGETTWNAIGKTQGQLDAPLSDLGRAQAAEAARLLASEPISRIVASPLSRARHTAEAAAEATGAALEFDPDLMECHLGELQGQPRGEFVREYFEGTWNPPGGEPYAAFAARVRAAMMRAVTGPGVLIVAHGGLWHAACGAASITPRLWPMPNALPIRVTPGPAEWRAEPLG